MSGILRPANSAGAVQGDWLDSQARLRHFRSARKSRHCPSCSSCRIWAMSGRHLTRARSRILVRGSMRPIPAAAMIGLASEVKALATLHAPEFCTDEVRQQPVAHQCGKCRRSLAAGDLNDRAILKVCFCHRGDLFKFAGRPDRNLSTKVFTSGTAHITSLTERVESPQGSLAEQARLRAHRARHVGHGP